MGSQKASDGTDLDTLLEQTRPPVPRRSRVKPPTPINRRPLGFMFKEWASTQVAAYRLGLVLSYVMMTYFGASASIAGIPTFEFTTPEGWTPIWGTAVVLGGLVAGIGALRAGSEPVTKIVRMFNRIELAGAIVLFLTLSTYATLLLVIGYGYGDAGRGSIGAGFVALGINPTVRMLWLIFRPRFVAANKGHTGPVLLPPRGYALFPVDDSGRPLQTSEASNPTEAHETIIRPGLEGA